MYSDEVDIFSKKSAPASALHYIDAVMLIGLEIHAKLLLERKLFSNALTKWNAPINTQADPFDIATPGTYPIYNKAATSIALKMANALKCKNVSDYLIFDRKHYDYFDLPHGYQITQQSFPIGRDGIFNGHAIRQIHLEMDSAKHASEGLDYNRAGVGLLEIVTEPDFTSIEDVVLFCSQLRLLLRVNKASDCLYERGSLRIDVNVSDDAGNSRCEIKNINSPDMISSAISSNLVQKQISLGKWSTFGIQDGDLVLTRHKQTSKEYLYLPEHDVPIMKVEKAQSDSVSIDKLKQSIGLDEKRANKLIEMHLHEAFLKLKHNNLNEDRVFNFLTNKVAGRMNEIGLDPFFCEDGLERIIIACLKMPFESIEHQTVDLLKGSSKKWPNYVNELKSEHLQILNNLKQHPKYFRCKEHNNYDALVGEAITLLKNECASIPNPRLITKFFKTID